MPFAGFKDFNDCLRKQRQHYSKEVAEKVCGKLYHQYEDKEKSDNPSFALAQSQSGESDDATQLLEEPEDSEETTEDEQEVDDVDTDTEKDQLGSVGFGGMIDANQQIKRLEHITKPDQQRMRNKKITQSGDFGDAQHTT